MRRVGLRVLMTLVGLVLLVVYATVAYLGYRLLAAVWLARADLLEVVVWTTALTIALGYLSYRFGTVGLLLRVSAADLPRARAPEIHHRLDRLAEEMAVTRPRLAVGRMGAPNAMALGGVRGGVVVLDRSVFFLLSADELEALLAHELAHLESKDSLVQTLAYSAGQSLVWVVVAVALPLVLVGSGLRRALDWIRGNPPADALAPVASLRRRVGRVVMVGFVALTLVMLAHSRRREYAADDRAAAVTGDPLALARALRKIERATEPRLKLSSPLYVHSEERAEVTRLLSTHPEMDERIDRLVERSDRERGAVSIEIR
ncbi:M48 family metalloprotease [Halorussus gelatinilyticus]|uniref:M48 family metalloprotease n=1 Tax=Halorussus gelatinilyticus TaxID=2937524 RepID=A0A8U0IHZ2_9EURY|nr:M48 family metalloprotease [Halorussus gelatinilyticus]UPV99698.1 M48 family metalloprotease [Halorussus gelatinilyticus]